MTLPRLLHQAPRQKPLAQAPLALGPKILAALLGCLLGASATPGSPASAAEPAQVLRLLERRGCPRCALQDADLVHADLRDADLRQAKLQRANLSGAQLEGANLTGADLSFTSLAGASLRGADLRGALLLGTDLRESDLTGALLDRQGLAQSHWQQARGLDTGQLGYAALHNAGVAEANQGRYPQAEQFFGEAIRQLPDAAISWIARGIARSEQGKTSLAAQDFNYASVLYARMGDPIEAEQLKKASQLLLDDPKAPKQSGNGMGSQLMGGALAAFQFLAPLAAKALVPMGL
jgi:tetratricopeptide (TPR) repeat protein